MVRHIPKVELHVHLEAAISPSMARALAKRQQLTLPQEIFLNDEQFACSDYYDFMKAYDVVAQVVRTDQDYYDITYDYLSRSSQQGCIYTELTISPGHAALVGLGYSDMLAGVVQGIDDARSHWGIESRIIIVFVRHHGPSFAERIKKELIKHLHPYVVGVGLAGIESSASSQDFADAFILAREAGLHATAHAGEACGPENIWNVLRYLPVERIGHGVRCIEDEKLMALLRERDIALEVCITSNIVTGVYSDVAEHPFLKLYQAGISVSLNSDDPTFFGTSIEKEYSIAKTIFGLTDIQLEGITTDAIRHSFAQPDVKDRLFHKIKNR